MDCRRLLICLFWGDLFCRWYYPLLLSYLCLTFWGDVMENQQTVMSSKGQIVIPKAIRQSLGLEPGQSFLLESTGEGILLKPVVQDFPETSLDDVAGCLSRTGQQPVTVEEMNAAIQRGVQEHSE